MQLHRKLVLAGKSLVNAALRPQSIPATTECDVLMTFPAHADESTLVWVLSRIKARAPQLIVTVHSFGSRHIPVTAFYISASTASLMVCAEELCIRKKQLTQRPGKGHASLLRGEGHPCQDDSFDAIPFTSLERQTMVHHMINCVRANDGEQICGVRLIDGQAIVPELVARGVIKQIQPLHDAEDLKLLRLHWVSSFSKEQPIDKVKEYFGPHIGMYFAYLGHYTWSLCVPAFIGLALWLLSGGDQFSDDVISVAFALFNMIWSTLYIEMWKRRSSELAYMWGTLDRKDDLIADPRPLYHGELVVSAVTGRKEPSYPSWKRNTFFYLISVPVITSCLLVIFVVSLTFLTLFGHVKEMVDKGQLFYPLKFLPMIMLGMAGFVLDRIYWKVAIWLNTKENYRLEEEYKNQLAIKLTLFQSVNAFMSLFYTAFYLQDFERLRYQLATLLIVRQIIGNMKESLFTFGVAHLKQYMYTKDAFSDAAERPVLSFGLMATAAASSGAGENDAAVGGRAQAAAALGSFTHHRQVSQAERESYMPRYDGTFDDYLEMAIQFGYVTWFSGIFPLAGFCALVNNFIEIRSDAFKLCASFQRPFGELARDIGAWEWVLEGMSMAALVVNAALIGMSGQVQRILPGLSTVQAVLLIVAVEHLVMIIKFSIRVAVNDAPEWVQVEMARLEYSRREALKKLQSPQTTDLRGASTEPARSRIRHLSESAAIATGHTHDSTF